MSLSQEKAENRQQMASNPVYDGLIVGAGNIGALFDQPSGDAILTHAHGFTEHPGFRLVGFVEPDEERRINAVSKWGGRGFRNLIEAFEHVSCDVVAVAAPDEYHHDVLKQLFHLPLRAIVAEKPLTRTTAEAQEVIGWSSSSGISVAVNYMRRFIPEFEELRDRIRDGFYGGYIAGNGYYGKGVLHNGSHLIDLARYFLGEIESFSVMDHVVDFDANDPSVSFSLQFRDQKKLYIQHIDCRLFTIFELDLLFEKGRARIRDSGFVIEEYRVEDSAAFKGYRNIIKVGEITTSLSKYAYHVLSNVYDHLTFGAPLKCSLDDGYRAVVLCGGVVETIRQQKNTHLLP